MTDTTLQTAKRLWKLGFALHWLLPKSKRPVESGWTTGPRKSWEDLRATYKEGFNLGVRTGEASKITDGYLCCIDVDIKDPKDLDVAEKALQALLSRDGPYIEVRSGSGHGSRHLYCLSREPFKMVTYAKHPGWEICIYSTGRQMVLPPSIHPKTGKPYKWYDGMPPSGPSDFLFLNYSWPDLTDDAKGAKKAASPGATVEDFEAVPVDLDWLPLSEEIKDGIVTGVDVSDRSSFLLRACRALLSVGLTQNEVLSVLTDRSYHLGGVGYDHTGSGSRRRAADWIYKYTLKALIDQRDPKNLFPPIDADDFEARAPLTPEDVEAQTVEFEEARDWQQDLTRTQNGKVAGTVKNVYMILTNEVSNDLVRRNTFAYRDTYSCDTPWKGKKGEAIGDDDIPLVKLWLSEKFELEPKRESLNDAFTNLACRNAFDPVREMLDALPAWDKKPRLDTWLAENFEAGGSAEYLAQVFRKWMFAMVLRVYEPGAKFDWMPIFEGPQGVGKSSFGRLLCGDKYFLDWLPNLGDKDSALALQGMWVVEMGELSQFRKNELEVIKGFLTRTVDKVRPPFGHRWVESARRCVFFGTTNREHYLRDDTGNRRFKPVKVGQLKFKALARDRVQLFAEAKWLYDQKLERPETLELTAGARSFEAKIHVEKMVQDDASAMEENLQLFTQKLEKNPDLYPGFDPLNFRLLELFEGGGPFTKWKWDQRNSQFAAKAIKNSGGDRRELHGKNVWRLTKRAENAGGIFE